MPSLFFALIKINGKNFFPILIIRVNLNLQAIISSGIIPKDYLRTIILGYLNCR